MSRMGARLRISTARHHTLELMAVLLAGVGLGVGAAALLDGHGSTTPQRVVPVARTEPEQTPGGALPPASAGVQPGRGEAGSASESRIQTEPEGADSRATAPLLAADAKASFARLAANLPGPVELALAPLGAGTPESLGGDTAAHGWSTTKIPVLAALLKAREDRGEGLTPEEQSWAQSAVTESNNESVLHLFGDLERIEGGLTRASRYMQKLFRLSGDEETVVATAPPPPGAVTTFGQTRWSPSNAVKFFSTR